MEYCLVRNENSEINQHLLNNLYKREIKVVNNTFAKLQLVLWNLINKLPYRKLFKGFLKRCSYCKRTYSEIVLDYYITRKLKCKKCGLKVKLYNSLVSIVMNLVESTLKMEKNSFRTIFKESPSLRKLVLSYMEGIGLFGLNVPQPPGGPIITIFSLTHMCNLRCKHCYIDPASQVSEMSYSEVCSVIDQLYEAKNFVLGFSGGEALLRKDIFDIIRYASSRHMNTALASNGTLITSEIAIKLKKSGLGMIQISIDGLEDVHDHIRGLGMFRKATRGIRNCINAGLYVSLDVVVTKLNVHQFLDVVELAKSLGIQKFEVLDFVPCDHADNLKKAVLNPLEMEYFATLVCDVWKKLIDDNYPMSLSYKNPIFSRIVAQRFRNVQVIPMFKGIFPREALKFFNFSNRLSKGVFNEQTPFGPFITGCEPGIYINHIKPNGEVTPCPLNPAVIGNVRKNHIRDIWRYSPVLNTYRKLQFGKSCGNCFYKTICGGCRAKVFIHKGNYTASDPGCILNCKSKKDYKQFIY